jgi:hypothetical protein
LRRAHQASSIEILERFSRADRSAAPQHIRHVDRSALRTDQDAIASTRITTWTASGANGEIHATSSPAVIRVRTSTGTLPVKLREDR